MKILKKRNGIALVAVLTIMLITSLFIPVMFNLTDTSLMVAITGTDRQRSSYLARTICEMSVAAFKKFDSEEYTKIDPNAIDEISGKKLTELYTGLTAAEKAHYDKLIAEYNKLKSGEKDKILTDTVYMYSTTTTGTEYVKVITRNGVEIENKISKKTYDELLIAYEDMTTKGEDPGYELRAYDNRTIEELVYATQGTDEYTTYSGNSAYTLVGSGYCEITYDNSVHYYKTITSTQKVEEVDEAQYEQLLNQLETNLKNNIAVDYSVSKKENKNVNFTSIATVKNITIRRNYNKTKKIFYNY